MTNKFSKKVSIVYELRCDVCGKEETGEAAPPVEGTIWSHGDWRIINVPDPASGFLPAVSGVDICSRTCAKVYFLGFVDGLYGDPVPSGVGIGET